MRVLISPKAEEDLIEIWRFLAIERSDKFADQFVDKIYEKMSLLKKMPQLGQKREELKLELRSLLVKPYVVFYSQNAKVCKIIRVLHCSRDILRHLK